MAMYVSIQISYAESLQILEKVYGRSVLSTTQVYEWYKGFKDGQETLMSCSDRPSTSSTDECIKDVKEIVLESLYGSVRAIVVEFDISCKPVCPLMFG